MQKTNKKFSFGKNENHFPKENFLYGAAARLELNYYSSSNIFSKTSCGTGLE